MPPLTPPGHSPGGTTGPASPQEIALSRLVQFLGVHPDTLLPPADAPNRSDSTNDAHRTPTSCETEPDDSPLWN